MIVPQLASGAWTPIERNERADSVRIVVAIISGKSTIKVEATLGRISPTIIVQCDAPRPRAASTNSFSRTESTWPRIGRATYGTYTSPIRRIGTQKLFAFRVNTQIFRPVSEASKTVAIEIASR